MFLVMLPLYQLISKRILYTIPIGEKIFLFQNDYAHVGLQKVLNYYIIYCINLYWQHFTAKTFFIKYKLIIWFEIISKLSKFKYLHRKMMVCMPIHSSTNVQKGYVVNNLDTICY